MGCRNVGFIIIRGQSWRSGSCFTPQIDWHVSLNRERTSSLRGSLVLFFYLWILYVWNRRSFMVIYLTCFMYFVNSINSCGVSLVWVGWSFTCTTSCEAVHVIMAYKERHSNRYTEIPMKEHDSCYRWIKQDWDFVKISENQFVRVLSIIGTTVNGYCTIT